MKPVKISPQVEWLVLECVKIIGLDIAGVDLLIDKVRHPYSHTVNIKPQTELDMRASVSNSRHRHTGGTCILCASGPEEEAARERAGVKRPADNRSYFQPASTATAAQQPPAVNRGAPQQP